MNEWVSPIGFHIERQRQVVNLQQWSPAAGSTVIIGWLFGTTFGLELFQGWNQLAGIIVACFKPKLASTNRKNA